LVRHHLDGCEAQQLATVDGTLAGIWVFSDPAGIAAHAGKVGSTVPAASPGRHMPPLGLVRSFGMNILRMR
jgi:hypothetical protein